jgi:hypothetical protein
MHLARFPGCVDCTRIDLCHIILRGRTLDGGFMVIHQRLNNSARFPIWGIWNKVRFMFILFPLSFSLPISLQNMPPYTFRRCSSFPA